MQHDQGKDETPDVSLGTKPECDYKIKNGKTVGDVACT